MLYEYDRSIITFNTLVHKQEREFLLNSDNKDIGFSLIFTVITLLHDVYETSLI